MARLMEIKTFYTYLWLREDGTPYYVGKGTGSRAFSRDQHIQIPPKDKSYILIQEFLTEQESFEAEKFLINFYGRKDLGTGCLRNLTEGGDGSSGYKHTSEAIQKIKENVRKQVHPYNKGRLGQKMSDEHKRKISEAHKGKKLSYTTKLKISRARSAMKRGSL